MSRKPGQGDAVFRNPLFEQCDLFPDKKLFTFHQADNPPDCLTGRELNRKIHLLGSFLEKRLPPQQSALVLLPQGLDFVCSLMACWYANVVAVPFALTDMVDPDCTAEKLGPLLADCGAAVILTNRDFTDFLGSKPAFRSVSLMDVAAVSETAVQPRPRLPTIDDTAMLLYTSGSTSHPKGVVLSHSHLIAQGRMAAEQWRMDDQSRIVSWAPLYHSFGLIVGLLAPLVKGAAVTLMPPGDFIKNPATWFRRLHQYAATHTGAPNFALDLCCSAIEPSAVSELSVEDLQAIICGGEPIRKATWETFVQKFGSIGFGKNKFCPNFGLSETGSIAFKPVGCSPRFLSLDVAALAEGRIIVSQKAESSRLVTSVGEIGPGIRALAVHPENCMPCAPDRIGEIWIKSPAVAAGYLNREKETAQTFGGTLRDTKETGFFRTGDLGFIRDNYLYIIGREKEVIIISGKNYHPVDIEWTIRELFPDSNRPVAVISRETGQREHVTVVREVDATQDGADRDKIARRILCSVSETHGLDLQEIILVPEGSIPKTGSGKIQRRLCRQAVEKGRLTVLHAYRQKDQPARDESVCPAAGIEAVLKKEAFLPECKVTSQQIESVSRFAELGLGSLQYIRIAGRIESLFKIHFTPVLFFKYRRFDQLAQYIAGQAAQAIKGGVARLPGRSRDLPDAGGQAAGDNAVAIIGMACRFPGGARDTETFWENMVNDVDAVTPIARSRPQVLQDARRYGGAEDQAFPQWGGFIDGADTFDADFFGISPLEAESMDPQQRKLLELVWEVLARSGYAPGSMAGEKIGVFVGAHNSDYAELVHRNPALVAIYGAFLDSGLHMSLMPHRISRWFDFRGPSELVNTACSSSLVAVHHAAASVGSGESRLAIACGVNLIFTSRVHLMALKAGMLSRDGRCKAFDASADGFARAEGVGAVVLKPLREAVRDNDTIYGIIKGSAVNHDGRSNSLRAPNLDGQKALIIEAWRAAGISPETIGYIETHGTGTALGDPVEIQALLEAYRETAPDPPAAFCGLGSVKTHMGHAESAAGIAGLIKVLMALKHRTLPGMLHFKTPNPWLPLSSGPFYIAARKGEWRPLKASDGSEIPRRAGVSSFGFGGANAHVIVEAYLPPEDQRAVPEPEAAATIIPLSARDRAGLRACADLLRAHLSKCGETLCLRDLAYTLQVGREAMRERAVFVVKDLYELIAELKKFVREGRLPDTFGAAGPENEARRTAHGWLQGQTVAWDELYACPKPRRIDLPAYPFAAQRHWIAEPETVTATQAETAELQGRAPAEEPQARTLMLLPVWQPVRGAENESALPEPATPPVVMGGTTAQQDAVRAVYPHARFLTIEPDADTACITALLKELPERNHLVWIARDRVLETPAHETVIQDQAVGLMQLFRITRALTMLGQGDTPLHWTLFTCRSLPVATTDAVNPTHAGVHGFIAALSGEHPAWRMRSIDLPDAGEDALARAIGLPYHTRETGFALRGGELLRRELVPVRESSPAGSAYRRNGVYVVIGGAGGLGRIWTRYMIEHYGAQIIWVGRRDKERLEKSDDTPHYIRADAADAAALARAFAAIKKIHPRIHGVVHSAVGLFDQPVADTQVNRFRAVLAAKIDVGVNIARIFQSEPLDFLLFFSSIAAFQANGGMAGYTAGCAFKDAFAQALARHCRGKVKVINWGYWHAGTGDRIPEAFKARIRRSGALPIRPEEGMAALETLLDSPMAQVAFVKSDDPATLGTLRTDDCAVIRPDSIPSVIDTVRQRFGEDAGAGRAAPPSPPDKSGLQALLLRLLGAQLGRMGLFNDNKTEILNLYGPWLAQSRRFLRSAGLLHAADNRETLAPDCADADALWRQWAKALPAWQQDPSTAAEAALAQSCLQALADILQGRRKATDILFPNACLKQVAGIFKDNPVADFFNHCLADALAAAVAARIHQDAGASIAILEIGAGTGGTTSAIVPKLQPYRQHIAEYCYTDLSQAFLIHGREQYGDKAPWLRTRIFDAARPLTPQQMPLGGYDMVVAANVLHATPDIRQTLRNAKAALRRGGLLFLNELSDLSLHAHLTFGLLEGWWTIQDAGLRIPGSPGLYPDTWRRLLAQEGFDAVFFPAEESHGLGQQIIVARSDGIIRQPMASTEELHAAARDGSVDVSTPVLHRTGHLKASAVTWLKKMLAEILRTRPDRIDPAASLEEHGVDSILMSRLTRTLQQSVGEVESTLIYEVRSIDGLADHLIRDKKESLCRVLDVRPSDVEAESSVGPAPATRPVAQQMTASAPVNDPAAPIAIIGLSGRYPGAETPAAYWEMLMAGRSGISEIPPDRWQWQAYFHDDPERAGALGKCYGRWGAFLDGCYQFDPRFFNMTPRDASRIDPQERLFLQAAWKALEDAGYAPCGLTPEQRSKTGVFGGITHQGFNRVSGDHRGAPPLASFAAMVNRVSYHLNLQGPSLPVDTMCSSSLAAIHSACDYLRSGKGWMAVAGGVNLYTHPDGFTALSRGRMLSATAHCAAFAKGGLGFVPGEGVGAVILKPLRQALRDRDFIYALIIGSSVCHEGKTAGYGIPDPVRQADLIRETLQDYDIDPRSISYIEAAANGSAQGDAVEAAALSKVFGRCDGDRDHYGIGSVKPNVGHGESVSGMAQLTKVVLALNHKTVPPTLLNGDPNPDIRFDRLPFRLLKAVTPWRPAAVDGVTQPLRAGITGIGAGGVNAHIVLEAYPPAPPSTDTPPGPFLFVLSARTRERLTVYADRWRDYLNHHPHANPERLAHTLQTGREAMACRLAVVFSGLDDLQAQLTAWRNNSQDTQTCFSGDMKAGRLSVPEAVPPVMARKDLGALARLWVLGTPVPWGQLYGGEPPLRAAGLPTYPFERRECKPVADAPQPGPAAAFYTHEARGVQPRFRQDYLTFAPFPEKIAGFSMSRVLLHPDRHPEENRQVKTRQIEMRRVLFRNIDFSRVRSVLDIGCGYGTDVIGIARQFAHIRTCGYTITQAQAEIGQQRIAETGLAGRAEIFDRDSAAAPFPGRYDLVIGIEVTFHIGDKEKLFGNIARALRPGANVLLVDYIANLKGAIVDADLDITIPTAPEWAGILADHGLVIREAVDVSDRIANFVHDPDFEENIAGLPDIRRRMWRNFAHQSIALEKGWLTYVLLTIRREETPDPAALRDRSVDALLRPVPYARALAEMQANQGIVYPGDDAPVADTGGEIRPVPEEDKSQPHIRSRLIRIFSQTLALAPEEIETHRPVRELGVGSINAVELLEAINTAFGRNLPTSLLFECDTLDALAACLAVNAGVSVADKTGTGPSPSTIRMRAASHRAPTARATPAQRPCGFGGEIAVVGLACRCAGADGPDAFWELVRDGKDCIREMDNPEWFEFFRRHADTPVPTRYGAMADTDCFDPLFFRISPKELAAMDITQRLLLEESYKALENAGYAPAGLKDNAVGTYVGVMNPASKQSDLSHFSLIGSETAILAARIAYFLDLKGPALAVNTACSSSLVAMHLACQALKNAEIDMALAGGVSIWDNPADFVTMTHAGMLSPTGVCRPFDARADGIVVGDGVGVVVLKRLADAEKDGDFIYGVIRGSGTNQDGRTAGITVPSYLSQGRLQAAVYREAGIDPEKIQYIEAHGTATRLGDPVEIHALTHSFSRFSDRKQFCAIGSLKANIGHTAAAAGVLSVIKTLLCLGHGQLPPAIHFDRENDHIQFQESPVFVNTERRKWPADTAGQRLAAVSSFGFSGTNAHMVLAGCDRPHRSHRFDGPFAVPLSAGSAHQLKSAAANLASFIAASQSAAPAEIDLADLAYTLQVGRDAMTERVCLVVTSMDELAAKLAAFLEGRTVPGLYRGRVATPGNETESKPEALDDGASTDARLDPSDSARPAARWVAGGTVAWHQLYNDHSPRRIPLPTYPFLRERHRPPAPIVLAETPGVQETLLFQPAWQPRTVPDDRPPAAYGRHRVMLPDDMAVEPADMQTIRLRTHAGDGGGRFETVAVALFEQLKQLLAGPVREDILVQVLVPAPDNGKATEPGWAGLAGLLNTARAENPHVVGQLIEVDPETDTATLTAILSENSRCPHDTHIRYIDGARHTSAWREVDWGTAPVPPWKTGGVYLITGGLGGLGMIFAREIVRTVEAPVVILTGRSAATPDMEKRIRTMADRAARVLYRQADVTCAKEVAALVREIEKTFGGLDGILHCAGILRDNYILKKPVDDFKAVLAPKVAGTLNLDGATAALDPDFFILFSSGAVLGNPGQADYAAANRFMDAFAEHRNQQAAGRRRGHTLSVNWPLWRAGGMQVDTQTEKNLRDDTGMTAMDEQTGIRALYQGLASGLGRIMVMTGHAGRIRQYLAATTSMDDASAADRNLDSKPDQALPRTTDPHTGKNKAAIIHLLKALLGEALDLPEERISSRESLDAYGIDSIIITQLNRKLAEIFGPIPKTLFFEYQTLQGLADYFAGVHGEVKVGADRAVPSDNRADNRADNSADNSADSGPDARSSDGEPIAIIGMAGHYPGADSLSAFWDLLRNRRSAIAPIPPERWSLEGFYEPDVQTALDRYQSYARSGGFLETFARFDPLFFNIAPEDAFTMDPQERLMLTACWEAMEDSGHCRNALKARYDGSVGVFVGVTKTGFELHTRLGQAPEACRLPRTSFSAMANRVSYHLDLNGPSLAVDTMCASAITAIHEACEHIHRGDCRLAFAGAVNLYLHPRNYIELCRGRIISPESEIHCFSSSGAGFVPGEGVGAVLLKPLARALADQDPVLAVIHATGINHGGKTNGYTVPNPVRQRALVRAVLHRARTEPDRIDYIETAANGSALGDAVELEALRRVFQKRAAPCYIGSVKPNIGHLEAAAGMSQLAKVLCQLQHHTLAPTRVRPERLDPDLNLESGPLRLVTAPRAWTGNGHARKALITSYGAGGAYAAMVIGEHAPASKPVRPAAPGKDTPDQLIVLCARTRDRLTQYARRLKDALARVDADLPTIAHTLQTGRDPMRHRLAVIARDREGVTDHLNVFLENKIAGVAAADPGDNVPAATGDARDIKTLRRHLSDEEIEDRVNTALADRDLQTLARFWLQGHDAIDWSRLHDGPLARCRLPVYPFEERRFWFNAGDGDGHPPAATVVPVQPGRAGQGGAAEMKQLLLTVIKEILFMGPTDELDPDAAFLDLGLDSVGVVRFIHKLSQRLHQPLRETLVFDYPTIGELAAHIADQATWTGTRTETAVPAGDFNRRLGEVLASHHEVVPLQAEDNGPVLFCFHPMSGDAGIYAKLADAARGRFRVIGIKARGLLSPGAPLTTIAGMGRHYAQILAAIEPGGPYHLLGASMGGAVAYETARRLQRQNSAAASLFLVEAPLVANDADARLWQTDPKQNRIMNANFLMITLCHMAPEFREAKAEGRIQWPALAITAEAAGDLTGADLDNRLADLVLARLSSYGVNQTREELVRRLVSMSRVHLANLAALSAYRAEPLDRPQAPRAFLLRTRSARAVSDQVYNPDYLRRIQKHKGSMAPFFEPWHRLLPNLTVTTIDGDTHFDLLNTAEAMQTMADLIVRGMGAPEGPVHPSDRTVMDLAATDGAASPAIGTARPNGKTFEPGRPEAIAVIGMSGRFPGAQTMDAFWQLLSNGRSALGDLPADRQWDLFTGSGNGGGRPAMGVRRGGFLKDIDRFDPLFFKIPPREAALADPAERLFLEESWRAVEDAGVDPSSLAGRPWGVFCGGGGDYTLRVKAVTGVSPHATASAIPGRVSYALGLNGPCVCADAGCAASLQAIAQACDALILGRCEAAIAGGAWILTTPNLLVNLSDAGVFSRSGAVRALTADADGMLPGEAVAAFVLKPLSRALTDRDRIYGVIEGWGGNHNGRTNGISAPSARAQRALLSDVYRRFGIDPASVDFVEAAATGTPLGDAIEIQALTDIFGACRCVIGSVENNIGHAFHASGAAHLAKILLALKHATIPGTLHAERPNPALNSGNGGFAVHTGSRPWKAAGGRTRRAATSSFGATGINVHLVVAEAPALPPIAAKTAFAPQRPVLIALSAGSKASLMRRCAALRDHLAAPENREQISPARLAANLLLRRFHVKDRGSFRCALVVSDIETLRRRLSRLVANEMPQETLMGRVTEAIDSDLAAAGRQMTAEPAGKASPGRGDLTALAELYVKGVPLDLSGCFSPEEKRPLSLPAYPFEKRRCWIDTAEDKEEKAGGEAADSSLGIIKALVVDITGYRDADIDPDTPLNHYGLDSLMGMRLLSRINDTFAATLHLADLAAHNTIRALAARLEEAPSLPDAKTDFHSAVLETQGAGPGAAGTALSESLKGALAKCIRRGIALLREDAGIICQAHADVDIQAALAVLSPDDRRVLRAELPAGAIIAPVSREQYLNLFHSEVMGQSSRNIQHIYACNTADLDLARLNRAAAAVARSQAALRTAYALWEDLFFQIIVPTARFDFSQVRMPDTAAFERFVAQQREVLLDLSTPPVWRGWVSRIRDTWYMAFVTHHSLADAFSTTRLFAQLMAAYHAHAADRPVAPQAAVEQYWQYALRQYARQDADIAAARSYWRKRLQGGTVAMRLPYSRDPQTIDPVLDADRFQAGARHIISLPGAFCASAERFNREYGITHTQLFTAATALLLAHGMGNPRAVIHFMTSRRDREALMHTLGEFTQLLFLVFAQGLNDPDTPVIDCLRTVNKACLDSLRHGRIDFSELLSLSGLASYENYCRQTGDVLFDSIDLDAATPAGTLPHGRTLFAENLLRPRSAQPDLRTFATLSYRLIKADQRLHLVTDYRKHFFEPSEMAHAAGLMVRMAEAMMRRPEQPLGRMMQALQDDFARVGQWSDRFSPPPHGVFREYRDARVLAALRELSAGTLTIEELQDFMAQGVVA